VGNVIYKNGNVYQIGHDEGRIVNGEYEYNIQDHLGNLRVAFRDSLGIAKITQSNSYGIFGEDLPSISYYKAQWKKDEFKFTGKENLPETGYTDFGARLYDNLVPRFITIDPLSEISRRFSPYTYANNNPIRFIDPDGMASEGFEYSNGYSTSNSRDNTGAVTFSGAYQNAGGGGGDDKPKVQPKQNVASGSLVMAGMRNAATRGGAGIALDGAATGTAVRGLATGLGYGTVIGGLLYLGTGGFQELVPDTPIADVGTNSDNFRIGVQYRLIAKTDGWFPDYRHKRQGGFGSEIPVAFTYLKAGETAKIGETMQWNIATQRQSRYSEAELRLWNVEFIKQFQGIQSAIKIREGQELLKYAMKHQFYLPPFNLMFK
jgi:RHS repeat-associated protein